MMKLILFILFLNAFVICGFGLEAGSLGVKVEDKKLVEAVDKTETSDKNNRVFSESKVNKQQDQNNHVNQSAKINKLDDKVLKNNGTVGKETASVQHKSSSKQKDESNQKLLPNDNGPQIREESEFVKTGSMILISISLLFIVFVAFKTYRRKSRNARIKKYGIRLTRGNIEMTPLPLDNDDEDETIFDLKNVPT